MIVNGPHRARGVGLGLLVWSPIRSFAYSLIRLFAHSLIRLRWGWGVGLGLLVGWGLGPLPAQEAQRSGSRDTPPPTADVAALQTYLARTLRGAPPVVVETAPNKPLRPPDEPESDEFERIVQTFAAYRSLLDGDVQLPAPTTVPSRPRAADAVITGREVSVRSGPGLKHERIAVAAQGTAVQVLQKTSEWSRVAFTNGTVGWVSQDLLRPQEKPAVPPAAALLPGPPAAPQGNHPFVAEALRHQGVPYVWGGASTSGFDCSGLIQYIARKYGLQVPHYAASLVHLGYPVPRSDLQAGDLVFFQNTYKPGVSHVGIYVGAGRFIHASSSHGVTTSDLSEAYYVEHYYSARRLLTPQEWREAPRTVRR